MDLNKPVCLFTTWQKPEYNTLICNVCDAPPTSEKRTIISLHVFIKLQTHLRHLNMDATNLDNLYHFDKTGFRLPNTRWKQCVLLSGFNSYKEASLRGAAGSLYVRNHFGSNGKKNIHEMIENIRNGFIQNIDKLEWLEESTKEEAKKKVAALDATLVGFPDEIRNSTKVNQLYSGLSITNNDHFKNHLNILSFWQKRHFERIGNSIDANHWSENLAITIVNGLYSISMNKMLFSAGIMSGYFYGDKRPTFMNYGSFGMVVGHEITHSLDNYGRNYDSKGKKRNWWNKNTDLLHYKNKTDCIIKQYNQYTSDQVHLQINGDNTKEENMADNGGIQSAYRAYGKRETILFKFINFLLI